MDSTPIDESISELAESDPADAVEKADAIADELESRLSSPEASASPDEVEQPPDQSGDDEEE